VSREETGETNVEHDDKVQLVVVGSIGLDDIETPFAKRARLLGGSVSYACAAASFFTRVGMVGIVGDDFPAEYSALYDALGIDTEGLQRASGKTFAWSGVYDADMINRRTLSTELNVFADFTPELPPAYRAAPYLLLGNISPGLQLHVLDEAEDPEFVAADTMDLWIETAREPLMELISRVDMLTLNDSEARLLTGEYHLKTCAARILEWGPAFVAIKKGEHGAMLFSRAGVFLLPAYPVDAVVDPTGAGDSFAGAFMGHIASAREASETVIRESLLYGAVVASYGVEAFSLERFEKLHIDHIWDRYGEFKSMLIAAG
jgi:sugar/nucleoside kinase (ribokinase family)